MESYIQFDNQVNEQARGTFIVSPLTGLLADDAMKHAETMAFRPMKPRIWIFYADDTFVVLSRLLVDQFHDFVNWLIAGVKFTAKHF